MVFEQQTIQGTAVLTIEQYGRDAKQLILDSRALQIDETEVSPDGVKYQEARFSIGASDKILGAPLRIDIAPNTKFVRIRYSTDPTATALQWLMPEQTAGKAHPFLYTQSQAIHARSWIPLQDSPGIRVTYKATVHVPKGLKAVMGATNCTPADVTRGVCNFVMDRPIPSYLIALAVGDLAFEATGPRTGVWAEVPVVAKAAAEFSFFLAVPTMLAASVKSLWDVHKDHPDVLNRENASLLGISGIVTFFVSILVIRFFIGFLQKHGFKVWGYYRIVVGLVMLVLLWRGIL